MYMNIWSSLLFLASVAFALCGCTSVPSRSSLPNPIVGAWIVKDPNAPFPYHLYVFNGDGTMQQANPDAGDPHNSDSDGKGVWVADGGQIPWTPGTEDVARQFRFLITRGRNGKTPDLFVSTSREIDSPSTFLQATSDCGRSSDPTRE